MAFESDRFLIQLVTHSLEKETKWWLLNDPVSGCLMFVQTGKLAGCDDQISFDMKSLVLVWEKKEEA